MQNRTSSCQRVSHSQCMFVDQLRCIRCKWRTEINNKPLQQQLHKKNQKCFCLLIDYTLSKYNLWCSIFLSCLLLHVRLLRCFYLLFLLSKKKYERKNNILFVLSLFFYGLNSQHIFVMCSSFNSHVWLSQVLSELPWFGWIRFLLFSQFTWTFHNLSMCHFFFSFRIRINTNSTLQKKF